MCWGQLLISRGHVSTKTGCMDLAKGGALKLEILNYMVEYSTSIHRNEVQT